MGKLGDKFELRFEALAFSIAEFHNYILSVLLEIKFLKIWQDSYNNFRIF